MSGNKQKPHLASHLILIKDNHVLLSRRFNTGWRDGEYSVVAGHIEENETASFAMSREALEEAGIEIDVYDLKMAHVMHRKAADERIDFFFTTEKWKGEPKNMEPHKCDHLDWFHLDNLPENMVPYVKAALNNYLNRLHFSEFGWE